MRKISLLLTLILISSFGFGQQKQKIDWKVGETKQIVMKLSGKEVNNGMTTKDTTLVLKSKLAVNEANSNSYKIHLTTDNQLITLGSHFYPGLPDKISKNSHLSMYLKVYKDSLSSEVLDSIDYNKALKASYKEILRILKTNIPDRFDAAKIELDKLYLSLKQKSEATDLMDYILDAYKVQYSETDTLITTDSLPNPFNKGKLIGTKWKTHVDKKSNNTYSIIVDKEYLFFDAHKDLMSNQMDRLTGTMKKMSPDGDNIDMAKEMEGMSRALMNSYKFKGNESFIIARNKNSNWPISLLKKTDLNVQVLDKKSQALIDILVEIK